MILPDASYKKEQNVTGGRAEKENTGQMLFFGREKERKILCAVCTAY